MAKNKKLSIESLEETQNKLNKVGEALGILDKIDLPKPEEIVSKDIILKNSKNQIRLSEDMELATMIEDFNFMRDTLRYNIEKSKTMMSIVGDSFNAYNEDSAMVITGYANLVKAVNDSINLFSNLHKTLNYIIDKKNKNDKDEKNIPLSGFSISDITKLIAKGGEENPIDVDFES